MRLIGQEIRFLNAGPVISVKYPSGDWLFSSYPILGVHQSMGAGINQVGQGAVQDSVENRAVPQRAFFGIARQQDAHRSRQFGVTDISVTLHGSIYLFESFTDSTAWLCLSIWDVCHMTRRS